jgi:ribosomal protein S14
MMRFYEKKFKSSSDNMLRLTYKECVGNIFSLRSLNDSNFNNKKSNNSFIIRTFSPKVRNKCILTGQSVSILSRFRISRLKFKNLAQFGSITGVLKALW